MTSWPELLSLAVHELRTPAGVVGGYLRMLQSEGADPLTERQRKMISEAEKSCGRLVAIISEMSEVSKLESGQIQLERKPVDIFTLAADVANGVHEAQDRDVRIDVRGPSSGAPLSGDTVRLRQALSAIFRAIAREQGSACVVAIDRRLDVQNGASSAVIVIAEESAVQAAYGSTVEPFDEKRGGLGLGLPYARRVVEGHGGRVASPAGHRNAAVISFHLPELNR